MISRSLLIIAILAPGLLCSAQDNVPVTTPAVTAAQAPPPAASAAQAPPAAASSDTYIIGANDMISVMVWKEPQLSGSLLVRPDGMITMPLVGDIPAAGLTPLHLADQIATKLKKYVQDPIVSIVVTGIHSKLIYIIGEGGKSGPIEMTPNMTLLEAIASAGGLSEYANKKKIYILRDVDGKRQKIPVHYKQALAGNLAFDLPLRPGDTIVIP